MGILSSLLVLTGGRQSHEAAAQPPGTAVTAQLNHRIMPFDRVSRYEDPLNQALRANHCGEAEDGGTMCLKSGEIEYIDVEMVLTNLTNGVPFVIAKLESFGAPKGSVLKIREGDNIRDVPFGKAEGIAVYLDGVNLPDDVYKKSDVNVVIAEFNKRLAGHGSFQGHWQGPTETALYFYGDDAEKLKLLISDFLESYPLCKGARVVTIAP
jgi:hypothetical protein